MTTFGLVHGHWHGAWCWDPLAAELERRGHTVVAMDLPCTEADAGCARNAEVVAGALDGTDGDVVLVGHSAGGLTIPLVPAHRRVEHLVFVCALLPRPDLSLAQQFEEESVIVNGFEYRDLGDGFTDVPPDMAVESFYHDCDPRLAEWAAGRLRRQTAKTIVETTPLEAWPNVPSTYVACAADRVIDPGWQRGAARTRLGVEPIVLACGHSPALARTAELAGVLDGVA